MPDEQQFAATADPGTANTVGDWGTDLRTPPVAPAAAPTDSTTRPEPPRRRRGGDSRPARPRISTYRYKLETAHGIKIKGKIRATSEDEARSLVAHPGADVQKIKKSSNFFSLEVRGGRVSRQELVIFARQLAAFARAGIPLIEALGSIGAENASRLMQDTLRLVALDLQEGVPLSESMAGHTKVFPAFFVDLVRAGEVTGNLDEVLERAAEYLDRQDEASKKIRNALAYPAVIFVVAVAVVVVLVAFVLPKFVVFFEDFQAELPAPTRALLAATDWLATNWLWVVVGIIAVVLVCLLILLTTTGQLLKDALLLKLPGLGDVIRYSIIERFCHTLSTLVAAGVPLVETFSVVIDGARNKVFQRGLTRVQEQMMIGQGMSTPIAATGLFPNTVSQMIRVGEDTGTLDAQLKIAADLYAKELDHRIKRFTALFEPLVIVVMGLIVGFVALALVSAMYGIFRQVGSI